MVAYTDVVILELQAKLDRYNSEIASGQRRFDSAMNNMGRSLKSMEARTATSFRNAASAVRGFYGFLAGAAVVQVARGYTQLADSATRMSNSLRIAGLEGEELKRVYAELYSAAQRNSTPIASLVDLYSKLSLSQSALGVTSQELMEFTDGIAVALRVAGTDATAAGGALLQLSQALGGGVVRAEEFNSMLEGTPTIVQAVARGLKEANGSVAELRKLVNEGKVSSTAFFRAFQAGSEVLREQAASSQTTVGQAFTRLGNSLVTVVGEFDKATGASTGFAEGISKLSDGLDSFDVSGFISEIQRIIDKFLEVFLEVEQAGTDWLNKLGNSSLFQGGEEEWFNTVTSPETGEAEEKIAALEREISDLQAKIEHNTEVGFDNTEAMARLAELKAELASVQAMAANLPRYFPGANMMTQGTFIGAEGYQPPPAAPVNKPAPRPADLVSIEDHPTAPSSGTKRRGGRSGGRGKGRSFDLEEELRQLQKRTDLINAETEALSKLDPLAEDYEAQMDKIRVEQELLNEAQAAGVALSPDVRAGISTMAEAYAQAEEQARKLKEAQDEIKDRHQEWIDTQKDAMKGFIQDLSAGKSAAEALAGALQKVADKLLDLAIDNLFSSGGGGGGGFLGSLVGFLFGKRAQGGPARKGLPYLVNENTLNSEVFVPSESGGVLNVPQAQEALAKAARVSSEYGSGRQAQPSPSRMMVKTEANFTFNLEGANGDKAIEDAVNRGIRQAAPILRDQAVKESVQTVGRMSRDGSKSFLGIR